MKILTGQEAKQAEAFFTVAAEVAKKSTCLNAHCGTVIVKRGKIIGEGYNSPPKDLEGNRTCHAELKTDLKPKYDKTCCVHAEWRAIIDAYKKHGADIEGSTLYFMRVDDDGNFTNAGKPYCTVCSRLTLESGVANFVLWNKERIESYDSAEYDRESYAFYK